MNQDEQDMVREAIQESYEQKEPAHIPFLNKYVIPGLSIILLLLLASYFVLGPVDYTIRGQLASSALKGNSFTFGDYVIVFNNDTHILLESLYVAYQEEELVETSVCLKGSVHDGIYDVREIFYPEIYEASYRHVSFAPCPQDTIIMLHTHPYKSCIASETDKETFASKSAANPDLLMLIMCEQQRFTLYDRSHIQE